MVAPAISSALIAAPVGMGMLLGMLVRSVVGRRCGGVMAAMACVVTPAAAVVGLVTRFPIVGLWDAGLEGLLLGLGVLGSAHRVLKDGRNVLLLASSLLVSLVALELLSRRFLPPPPAFPMRGGPHLLLANALRADLTHQPWDTLSKDFVCSIVYGNRYPPIFDLTNVRREIVSPQSFKPRPDARRRVLHLGDSMAFGFGLARTETFTAALERVEPDVQHINGGIPGTAPDAYLAVLQSWIASHALDLVVMHVYEGNDLDGLDSRYPCCDWQPLLAYQPEGATLQCPQGTAPALGHAGFSWLRYHNPPPYLVRALVGTSSAAAHIAAAMAREPYFLSDQPVPTRLEHLGAIVRSARDTLAARHIEFVVDVLPARSWLETRATWQRYGPQILDSVHRAGVAALDPSEFFLDAVGQGRPLFFENNDIHFNATGHALWASWLHERLSPPPTAAP